MKKIVLIDGTNLIFRSYYATAYTNNFMYTSYNFPTNALYGLTNMINKILKDENPDYILAAFDKGKTFRHSKYEDYKAGRKETPEELKVQFPKGKELLQKMGVHYYEIENYEADDIIGTISKQADKTGEFETIIISSDKDFLQLASPNTTIKLVSKGQLVPYTPEKLFEEYQLEPDQIRDLKGLEGDKSDNIPGVPGVGPKTALKLLWEHKTVEGIYEHIDTVKGKLKEKLEANQEQALFSKEIATIHREVPLPISIPDIEYVGYDYKQLSDLYKELEFKTFLKRLRPQEEHVVEQDATSIGVVSEFRSDLFEDGSILHFELDGINYHKAPLVGVGVKNSKGFYFIPKDVFRTFPKDCLKGIKDVNIYDAKRSLVALNWLGFEGFEFSFDAMLAGYLININVKDDMAAMADSFGFSLPFEEEIYGKGAKRAIPEQGVISTYVLKKLQFIDKYMKEIKTLIKESNLEELLYDLEQPLSVVLASMEYSGITIDQSVLDELDEKITDELVGIEKRVYEFAGKEFNIASPKQLGVILFEELGIRYPKRKKGNFSTAVDVLEKIKEDHPIVSELLRFRTLAKLKSTYLNGLSSVVFDDGKIHTIFNQVIAQTGRLSSIEPNIQNIPVRTEIGREIRRAFVASENNILLAADYSQIELRVMAHISGAENLTDAFNHNIDIHTKTASEIYGVSVDEVTSNMRRNAKAVNFGILYGQTSFGLSQNLDIEFDEAKRFIETYLEKYPGIKGYMDGVVEGCKTHGYVTTILNRRRYINDINDKNFMKRQFAERMAMNTPIQGSAADIIKKAMIDVFNKMNELNLKSKMIVQVHDELIFDIVPEELELMEKLVVETMEHCFELNVPLKVDYNKGHSWYEAK
jgi:DNA polymerase-1